MSCIASALKPPRRGTMSGCHCARNVIAILISIEVWEVELNERTPHDVAACEGEYEGTAPDSAESQFGSEKFVKK